MKILSSQAHKRIRERLQADVDDHERCHRPGCPGHYSYSEYVLCETRWKLVQRAIDLIQIALTTVGYRTSRQTSNADLTMDENQLVIHDPQGKAFSIHVERIPSADECVCEGCRKIIPRVELVAWREEAGDDSSPRLCTWCSENEDLTDRR